MSERKIFPVTLIFKQIELLKGEECHSYKNDEELNVVFTTTEGGKIDIPILDIIKRETKCKEINQNIIDRLEKLFSESTFEGHCFDNYRDECDLDYFNHTDLITKVEDKIIYWSYKGEFKDL